MGRRRVYVVEDDDQVRNSLVLLLRIAGYEVEAYAEGKTFLEEADLRGEAVVLLDLRLPGVDGLEMMRLLKRLSSSLTAVMLTGEAETSTGEEAMKAGVSEYLEKPCDPELLLQAVERASRAASRSITPQAN